MRCNKFNKKICCCNFLCVTGRTRYLTCVFRHTAAPRGFLMCFRILFLTREAFSNSILTLRLRVLAKSMLSLGNDNFPCLDLVDLGHYGTRVCVGIYTTVSSEKVSSKLLQVT
jgi:hypothetical protein